MEKKEFFFLSLLSFLFCDGGQVGRITPHLKVRPLLWVSFEFGLGFVLSLHRKFMPTYPLYVCRTCHGDDVMVILASFSAQNRMGFG